MGLSRNSRNSRFGAFNSRFGAANSRFDSQREFAVNHLVCLNVFAAKWPRIWGKSKNSRLNGKNREFALAGHEPAVFPAALGASRLWRRLRVRGRRNS